MTPRFFKWDFDNKEVIEYERIGECNGCGQCCAARIAYKVGTKRTGEWELQMGKDNPSTVYNAGVMSYAPDDARTGVWSEYKDGDHRRFIGLPVITFDEKP